MKSEYLLVKGKDDFCQDIEQFKNLLASNTRLVLNGNTLEADQKKLTYSIVMYNVTASKETVFHLTLEATQEKEEEQVVALESAEAVLRRINDKVGSFQINTIWDDVSMYYGRKLYPSIIEVEALLREIIYLFMIKNVGSKWLKEQSPEEVKSAIKKTLQKNQIEEPYPDTDALIYADFITLGWFFFSKYPLKSDYQNLLQTLKREENLTQEKINELIEQYESKSNWDRYFADKITVEKLSEKWTELYNYRNKVAHTKKILKDEYKKAKAIIDELKPAFLECLKHLNSINMTEAESEAVEDVAEQTIAPRTVYVMGGKDGNSLLYTSSSPVINSDIIGEAKINFGLATDRFVRPLQLEGMSVGLSDLKVTPTQSFFSDGILHLAEPIEKSYSNLISGMGLESLATTTSPLSSSLGSKSILEQATKVTLPSRENTDTVGLENKIK